MELLAELCVACYCCRRNQNLRVQYNHERFVSVPIYSFVFRYSTRPYYRYVPSCGTVNNTLRAGDLFRDEKKKPTTESSNVLLYYDKLV